MTRKAFGAAAISAVSVTIVSILLLRLRAAEHPKATQQRDSPPSQFSWFDISLESFTEVVPVVTIGTILTIGVAAYLLLRSL